MTKLVVAVFLAFIFLMILLGGCIPASTPLPPTDTSIPPTDTPLSTETPVPTATQPPPTATPESGPALYVLSKNGAVTRVSLNGDKRKILEGVSGSGFGYAFDLVDSIFYVNNSDWSEILAYDLEGTLLKTIPVPTDARSIEFKVLPDGRFALLNNYEDKVYFIDSTGKLITTANILATKDNDGQNVNTVVVDNRLILSEDGKDRLLAFDLNTYERSIFKDFSGLRAPFLGSIAYDSEYFYLATTDTIYRFTETSFAEIVAKLPLGNITGIVILDGIAYVSVNLNGAIYKVNLADGSVSKFVDAIYYPNGLKFSE